MHMHRPREAETAMKKNRGRVFILFCCSVGSVGSVWLSLAQWAQWAQWAMVGGPYLNFSVLLAPCVDDWAGSPPLNCHAASTYVNKRNRQPMTVDIDLTAIFIAFVLRL